LENIEDMKADIVDEVLGIIPIGYYKWNKFNSLEDLQYVVIQVSGSRLDDYALRKKAKEFHKQTIELTIKGGHKLQLAFRDSPQAKNWKNAIMIERASLPII
jgi:hypothetical protein